MVPNEPRQKASFQLQGSVRNKDLNGPEVSSGPSPPLHLVASVSLPPSPEAPTFKGVGHAKRLVRTDPGENAAVSRFAIAGIPLLLVPAFGVFQGGFRSDTWVWGAALAAWAAALGAVVSHRSGALRATWRWPAVGAALLLWTLASEFWSAEPHQSVLEARRTLVYALVVLALVVLARSHATQTLVLATHVAITVLLTYALLRYLLGARRLLAFEGYVITQPLGYANTVGILAAMGILLALMAATDERPALRVWGAATVPLLALTLTFSESYASWLALGLGTFVVWILTPQRKVVVRTLVLLASLRCRSSGSALQPLRGLHIAASRRTTRGCCGVAAIAAGSCSSRRCAVGSPRVLRRPGALAVAVTLAVVVQPRRDAAGGSRHRRRTTTSPGTSTSPIRGSVRAQAPSATLAGLWPRLTLGRSTRRPFALPRDACRLGPVGLLLVVAFLVYPLRRAVASRNTPGVPVACGAAVAFLVHAGLDWDWEMPVVVVAGIACLAAVLFADKPQPDRRFESIAGSATSAEPSALGNEAPQSGASAEIT